MDLTRIRAAGARIGPPLVRAGAALAHHGPAFIGRWLLRILLPLGGAATMLHLFPYYTTAAGLQLRVQGSIVTQPGISADTTIGNWQFPHVDGLPVGVHISPQNVDLLRLTTTVNANSQTFTTTLRDDLNRQVPTILWWLGGETVLGILFGLLIAAGANLAVRYLRGQTRVPHQLRAELKHRGLQLAAAFAVVVLIVGYGGLTYNSHWSRQSKLTGTLGAVQLVPEQLQRFYNHQSKAFDVVSAISGIQAELQQQIVSHDVADTAYNMMFISDMHLASTYPLVEQYAENFNVKLIVNTGDETEFGTSFELSNTYIDQISTLTKRFPMIWLAGNHDSPDTVATMRSIPGVTVLGTKTSHSPGYQVSAQYVTADGLTIAGVPDPRVYGASGVYGSDKDSEIDPLEKSAVDNAVKSIPKAMHFDIFATHEPVAANELAKDLSGRITQVNSGHTHAQNDTAQVQHGSTIDLVEGSTGAGGLDAIGSNPPPVEFSIESVGADCQFTKVVRFQIGNPAGSTTSSTSDSSSASTGTSSASSGQQVSASTIYLKAQNAEPLRYCSSASGISAVADVGTATR